MAKDAIRDGFTPSYVYYIDEGEFWEINRVGKHGVSVKQRVSVLWNHEKGKKWRYATEEEEAQIRKAGDDALPKFTGRKRA